jgi:hypothetical protein
MKNIVAEFLKLEPTREAVLVEYKQLYALYKRARGRNRLELFKGLDTLLERLGLPPVYRRGVIDGRFPINDGFPCLDDLPDRWDIYMARSRSGEYGYVRGPDKDGYPHFELRHKITGKLANDYLLPMDHEEYEGVTDEEISAWRVE